jgi:very-short-patch-repair endonuclease
VFIFEQPNITNVTNREEYYRQVELIEKSTKAEVFIRDLLDVNKIEYIQNYPIKINERCTFFIDFYLIDFGVYLEIDGGYHNTSLQKKKDLCRGNLIWSASKLREIRIKNKDVFSLNNERLYKIIMSNKPVRFKQKKQKKTQKQKLDELAKRYPDPNKIRKH